jgi:hypothetical protein
MHIWPARRSPRLRIGTLANGFPLWPGSFTLDAQLIDTHRHVIGVSGVGKSKLLESIFLQLHRQGIAVSFLDPHADSAEALLRALIGKGFFRQPDAFHRLLYVDFSQEEFRLPFNVLRQSAAQPQTIAANILEAFHRAWPALGEGAAPQFDNLVLAGTLVLIENGVPLPALHRLLTDRSFRDGLLDNVSDQDTVAFFHDRFDRWSRYEAPQMIESTLRRLFLLTFSPTLKYSLGQADNSLDFRRILDLGQSVIFNLGVQDPDARRLLGCLITIGYEQAALSRRDLSPTERRPHHLLLDEFSDYSAQSEEALSDMLSQTRKFGLFSTMAHQTWSQASYRLQGALQNVGVKIAMRVGRHDAEILARALGSVDPLQVKAEPASPTGQPVFMELQSQWEQWISMLTDLAPREALVKASGKPAMHVKTLPLPVPKVPDAEVQRVKRRYRDALMRPQDELAPAHHGPRDGETTHRTVDMAQTNAKVAA